MANQFTLKPSILGVESQPSFKDTPPPRYAAIAFPPKAGSSAPSGASAPSDVFESAEPVKAKKSASNPGLRRSVSREKWEEFVDNTSSNNRYHQRYLAIKAASASALPAMAAAADVAPAAVTAKAERSLPQAASSGSLPLSSSAAPHKTATPGDLTCVAEAGSDSETEGLHTECTPEQIVQFAGWVRSGEMLLADLPALLGTENSNKIKRAVQAP